MALTPEQAKSMLDSLFAMPDKVAKPKQVTQAKPKTVAVKPARIRTTLGLTAAGFLPAMRKLTVMHQHCATCNSDTQYILPAVIRFEDKKGVAIEIPASVAEHLPTTVITDWQTVHQCPVCLAMSRNIEDLMCISASPTQMELFQS